jgi:hypothetical protein
MIIAMIRSAQPYVTKNSVAVCSFILTWDFLVSLKEIDEEALFSLSLSCLILRFRLSM